MASITLHVVVNAWLASPTGSPSYHSLFFSDHVGNDNKHTHKTRDISTCFLIHTI